MPVPNPLLNQPYGLAPINSIQVVTPSDTVDLPGGPCRGLMFTGAGNVVLITGNGETVTLAITTSNNGVLPVVATRIKATGTTVTTVFACY